LEGVEMLVEAEAEVDAVNDEGMEALRFATW
jgi:hypothetical protein